MYIRITSRCNMSCEHCCYSCTEKGEDMSLDVFRAALEMDENISIGGGEPTLHPLFWQMIGESIANCEYVWLATNGSQTNTSLALAKMAQKYVIGCELSQDDYHDRIDQDVIDAFTNMDDGRGIRNVTAREINAGRCDFGSDEGCVCQDLIVEPDGTIKACGCEDAPTFGTVFDTEIPEDWEIGECHKEQGALIS